METQTLKHLISNFSVLVVQFIPLFAIFDCVTYVKPFLQLHSKNAVQTNLVTVLNAK